MLDRIKIKKKQTEKTPEALPEKPEKVNLRSPEPSEVAAREHFGKMNRKPDRKNIDLISGQELSNQELSTSLQQTNKPDFESLIAKYDEKQQSSTEGAGNADPSAALPAAPDVFAPDEFIEFWCSVFGIASGLSGYKSLHLDKSKAETVEGLRGVYRIADRHPRLRWIIKPMHEDLKDGAVAAMLIGGMVKGVAAEKREKVEAKKAEKDKELGAEGDFSKAKSAVEKAKNTIDPASLDERSIKL